MMDKDELENSNQRKFPGYRPKTSLKEDYRIKRNGRKINNKNRARKRAGSSALIRRASRSSQYSRGSSAAGSRQGVNPYDPNFVGFQTEVPRGQPGPDNGEYYEEDQEGSRHVHFDDQEQQEGFEGETGADYYDEDHGEYLRNSIKIGDKNVRLRRINGFQKQRNLYNSMRRVNPVTDSYFYPNPKQLIHPRKKALKSMPNDQENLNKFISSPLKNFAKANKISKFLDFFDFLTNFLVKEPKQRGQYFSQTPSHQPYVGRRNGPQSSQLRKRRKRPIAGDFFGKGKFKEADDGMLVAKDHWNSIYDSDFLASALMARDKKKSKKLYRGDFNLDDYPNDDLITPFHYDQVIRRSNGYSRNTYGQMFRPGR